MDAAAMIQAANGVNTSSGSSGSTKKTSKSSDFSGMLQSKAREVGPGYQNNTDTRKQVARTSGKQASSSRNQSESTTTAKTSTTKGPGASNSAKSDLKTKSDQERSLVETMVQAAQGNSSALQSLQPNADTTATAAGEEAAALEGVTANMLMDMVPDSAVDTAALATENTVTDGQLLMDQLSDAAAADAVQAAVESGAGSIGTDTKEAAGPGDMLMDQAVNGNRVVPSSELVRKIVTTSGEVKYLEGSQYTSGDAEGSNLPGGMTAGQTVINAQTVQTGPAATASAVSQGTTNQSVTASQNVAEELAKQQRIVTNGSSSTVTSQAAATSQDAQGFGPGFAAAITNTQSAPNTSTNTGSSAGQTSEEALAQAAAQAHAQAVGNAQSTATPVSAQEVQASQGTVTMKTSEATFPQDIQNVLRTSMPTQDGGKLTIELDPATLGKITINVSYEGDKATVSILASNPKTLELLTNSAPQMAGIIESKTGQQTTVYIPTNTTASDYQSDFASANQEGSGEGQAEQRRRQQESNQSGSNADAFLQQMRLGLV